MTSSEFLADVATKKGAGYVRILQKWLEIKAKLAEAEGDPSLLQIRQNALSTELSSELGREGFHGVMPPAIYADAETFQQLREQEAAGGDQD